MLGFLTAVAVGIGVGKIVDFGLKGLALLAKKTSTKKDDQLIAFLQEHAPDLVELAERYIIAKPTAAASRPALRDHRDHREPGKLN